jgi:hypothetical protein
MKQDPGIDWIRAVRSTISHEVHNDPKELIAFHRSLRGKYGRESQHADAPDGAPRRPKTVAGAHRS